MAELPEDPSDPAEDWSDASQAEYSSDGEPQPNPLVSFDWSDLALVPMPQEEGDPFFIIYTEDYIEIFGRFNAILDKQEESPRVLALCNWIISQWPKHVTAWWYKFRLLENLGYDFETEMKRIEDDLRYDIKSYQAWHYRQWLVDRSPEPVDELPKLGKLLHIDEKNVHAWNYAIWWARRNHKQQVVYNLALEHIESDCRNNSAWNARKLLGEDLSVDPTAEFETCLENLRDVGKNEAALNFLKAMADREPALKARLRPAAEELIGLGRDNPFGWVLLLSQATDQEEITRLCDQLIESDAIRTPYYNLVKQGVIHCV
jgi:protein farnesyltransferase/geranylgeranyltransferase type-1 subunit alpha